MNVSEDPRFAIVRAAYGASGRGDGAAFLELFADDAVAEQWPGLPWVPETGEAPIRAFAEAAGRFIQSAQTIDELFLDGDDVVAIGRSRGVAINTGRGFDVRIVHRWRLQNGKIILWRLHVETAPLMAALQEREA